MSPRFRFSCRWRNSIVTPLANRSCYHLVCGRRVRPYPAEHCAAHPAVTGRAAGRQSYLDLPFLQTVCLKVVAGWRFTVEALTNLPVIALLLTLIGFSNVAG